MVKGFEEYTGPLNDYERTTVMPRVASILTFCVGPEKAATNKDLRENLLATYNLKVSDPRVRAIINEIRTSDVVPYLVASSKGYYIATSVDEVEDYARIIVETRIILQTVKTRVHKNTYFSYQIPHFSRNIEIYI